MSEKITKKPPEGPKWCGTCHRIIYRAADWRVSWFKNEEICVKCDDEEADLKIRLVKAGRNPKDYEGCGYLPKM